jgi:hypothetical protein
MGIVNKRNAVVGWVVVKVGKRAVKKKAQEAAAAPGARTGGAVAGALAALAGLLMLKRKKRSTDAD